MLKLADDFFTKADYTNLMPILKDVIAAEYPAATANANEYCARMYAMAEDHLSNNRYQSALDLMKELSVLNYSDSASRKTQLENKIAEDEKQIDGTWYSSNAWFSGAWLYVENGRWAWTAFKDDLKDYKSGKYQGSKYTYDPDTQTYTFRVTKHANGEKDYLTAKISNGKLIIKSTDKDEAFYPGTYKRI